MDGRTDRRNKCFLRRLLDGAQLYDLLSNLRFACLSIDYFVRHHNIKTLAIGI